MAAATFAPFTFATVSLSLGLKEERPRDFLFLAEMGWPFVVLTGASLRVGLRRVGVTELDVSWRSLRYGWWILFPMAVEGWAFSERFELNFLQASAVVGAAAMSAILAIVFWDWLPARLRERIPQKYSTGASPATSSRNWEEHELRPKRHVAKGVALLFVGTFPLALAHLILVSPLTHERFDLDLLLAGVLGWPLVATAAWAFRRGVRSLGLLLPIRSRGSPGARRS